MSEREHTLPLDEDELERLDELLERYSAREDGFDLEQLDGFFAALAIGPERIPPSRYLPVIGGENPNGFDSAADMEEFMLLLVRHAQWVERELVVARKPVYQPLIFPPEAYENEQEATELCAVKWALGFVEGLEFYEDAWDEAAEADESVAELDGYVAALLTMEEDEDGGQPLTLDERLAVIDALPGCLIAASVAFAAERRDDAQARTVVRDAPKVGRNDPCPCGSGKKFKQCCGK